MASGLIDLPCANPPATMRAADLWAIPIPSPRKMMMFLTFCPPFSNGTISKLPVATTFWPSLCVAVTEKV